MNISYSVTFHTYWHCGSGLAAGADADLLVVKDKDRLPFIPGKTIKGLIKEAVDDLSAIKGEDTIQKSEDYLKVFGRPCSVEEEMDAFESKSFFSNLELKEKEHEEIVKGQLADMLYTGISQTSIDDNGIAKSQSLRRTEVVIPCQLFGYITDVPESFVPNIKEAMAFIKYLGHGRNRGLGRCTLEMED